MKQPTHRSPKGLETETACAVHPAPKGVYSSGHPTPKVNYRYKYIGIEPERRREGRNIRENQRKRAWENGGETKEGARQGERLKGKRRGKRQERKTERGGAGDGRKRE